ncbi:hypothetical protein V6N11_019855 [Hibiscus sabdariffa]|uniref:Uncharacterized protein n=2 Tax=Hibiscus sabdariffa TaxID=183260 RepID=A0ABR2A6Q1_9ROSI
MGDNVSKNRRRHDGDGEGTENGEQLHTALFARKPTAADERWQRWLWGSLDDFERDPSSYFRDLHRSG